MNYLGHISKYLRDNFFLLRKAFSARIHESEKYVKKTKIAATKQHLPHIGYKIGNKRKNHIKNISEMYRCKYFESKIAYV